MIFSRLLTILLFSLGIASGAQAAQWTTPLIEGYGKVQYDANAAFQPKLDEQYKVVFAIDSDRQHDGVNADLWIVARFMNLMAAAGMDPDNVEVVAMISGSATPLAMNDKLYRQRNDALNPDQELLKALADNGVKIYVCEQALAGFDIDPANQVNEHIEPVLSALTTIPQLQMDGYVLMP
ncbi:MAG TPA: DsrE family protein [Halomonas sp.]|nr:DsrE family protein [Halomonas sp.]